MVDRVEEFVFLLTKCLAYFSWFTFRLKQILKNEQNFYYPIKYFSLIFIPLNSISVFDPPSVHFMADKKSDFRDPGKLFKYLHSNITLFDVTLT